MTKPYATAKEDGAHSRRGSKPLDVQQLNSAFALAEREQAELRRLKASGKPLCQLEFVGAFGYAED